jgi:hypothetical protein
LAGFRRIFSSIFYVKHISKVATGALFSQAKTEVLPVQLVKKTLRAARQSDRAFAAAPARSPHQAITRDAWIAALGLLP